MLSSIIIDISIRLFHDPSVSKYESEWISYIMWKLYIFCTPQYFFQLTWSTIGAFVITLGSSSIKGSILVTFWLSPLTTWVSLETYKTIVPF
jgi:hypothetical protein